MKNFQLPILCIFLSLNLNLGRSERESYAPAQLLAQEEHGAEDRSYNEFGADIQNFREDGGRSISGDIVDDLELQEFKQLVRDGIEVRCALNSYTPCLT